MVEQLSLIPTETSVSRSGEIVRIVHTSEEVVISCNMNGHLEHFKETPAFYKLHQPYVGWWGVVHSDESRTYQPNPPLLA